MRVGPFWNTLFVFFIESVSVSFSLLFFSSSFPSRTFLLLQECIGYLLISLSFFLLSPLFSIPEPSVFYFKFFFFPFLPPLFSSESQQGQRKINEMRWNGIKRDSPPSCFPLLFITRHHHHHHHYHYYFITVLLYYCYCLPVGRFFMSNGTKSCSAISSHIRHHLHLSIWGEVGKDIWHNLSRSITSLLLHSVSFDLGHSTSLLVEVRLWNTSHSDLISAIELCAI